MNPFLQDQVEIAETLRKDNQNQILIYNGIIIEVAPLRNPKNPYTLRNY